MAVTIKGFASDWSVPEPAQAKLGELYATPETVDTKIASRLVVSQTEPANPFAGMIWFDTTPADYDPLDSLSGLMARWRADDLDLASGANVSTVDPRSGSTSVALSAPAGNEPTLSTTFAGSHKALTFSGAEGDHMAFNLGPTDAPLTVFSVVNIAAGGTYVYSGQTTNYVGMLTNSGGTTVRINGTTNNTGGITVPWTPSSGIAVTAAVYVPGTNAGRFYYNALTPTVGTVSTNQMANVGAMYLGRGSSAAPAATSGFTLADLAFVSGELPDADVKTVMQSLADYYGLTLGA